MNTIYSIRTTKASLLLVAGMALASCNDYLDTEPSHGDNEVLHTTEQVEALFNNSEITNTGTSFAISQGDDIGLSPEIYDQMGWMDENSMNGFVFGTDDIANSPYGDEGWEKEYNKVFVANLVINGIDEVEDMTDTQRAQYLAQAHFMRGLALWNLASLYCLPYSDANAQELGLPCPTENDYEGDVSRLSLADTYAFIRADLLAALESPMTDVDKRWWVSKPAAAAMLARFDLFTGQYAEGAQYAREALQSTKVTLQDYNTLTTIPQILMNMDGESEEVNFSELYSYSPNQLMDYQENYYSQYAEVRSGLYLIPSDELTALYDPDSDLRYEQFFNKHALWQQYIFGVGDDVQYHKFSSTYSEEMQQSGPTRPEMLLTLAECEARQGNIAEAMAAVNELRQMRMRQGADGVMLSASSQQEAVEQILDERHREMPFLMRWGDIRRLSCNEVSYDDVAVKHTFYGVENNSADYSAIYEYTLPVGSRRYAQPINYLEIKRTNGQIEQNIYSNGDVVKTELPDYYGDDDPYGDDEYDDTYDE